MSGRLADAIVVARELLMRFPEVLSVRMGAHPLVGECSNPAAGVAVFENLGEGAMSLEEAVRCHASSVSGSNYEIRKTDVPADVASIPSGEDGRDKTPDRIIRSILLRYPQHAHILIVDNLNACWKRFAMCKEFAHLIMDEGDGHRAMSVAEQIDFAMDIARSPDPHQELTGEAFAWFTAVELLLPITDRTNLMARHGAGEDHITLARSYWVPRPIIDMFFGTPYLQVSNSLR